MPVLRVSCGVEEGEEILMRVLGRKWRQAVTPPFLSGTTEASGRGGHKDSPTSPLIACPYLSIQMSPSPSPSSLTTLHCSFHPGSSRTSPPACLSGHQLSLSQHPTPIYLSFFLSLMTPLLLSAFHIGFSSPCLHPSLSLPRAIALVCISRCVISVFSRWLVKQLGSAGGAAISPPHCFSLSISQDFVMPNLWVRGLPLIFPLQTHTHSYTHD